MFFSFLGTSTMMVVYGAFLCFLIIQFMCLIFIPAMLSQGAKPMSVGKAVYCYALQALGIFLMAIGGMPAVSAVFQRLFTSYDPLTTEMYIALLILFSLGGFTFLWHERMAQAIDEPSKRVCASVYWFTFKLLGYLLSLFSLIAFVFMLLFAAGLSGPTWWIDPVLLFLFGMLLTWCMRDTSSPMKSTPTFRPSTPTPPTRTLIASTPTVSKKPTPKKKPMPMKKKLEPLELK